MGSTSENFKNAIGRHKKSLFCNKGGEEQQADMSVVDERELGWILEALETDRVLRRKVRLNKEVTVSGMTT